MEWLVGVGGGVMVRWTRYGGRYDVLWELEVEDRRRGWRLSVVVFGR